MPDQRIAQASACFLFEFGNGEKLIFDLGTGSMRNVASLMSRMNTWTRASRYALSRPFTPVMGQSVLLSTTKA